MPGKGNGGRFSVIRWIIPADALPLRVEWRDPGAPGGWLEPKINVNSEPNVSRKGGIILEQAVPVVDAFVFFGNGRLAARRVVSGHQ